MGIKMGKIQETFLCVLNINTLHSYHQGSPIVRLLPSSRSSYHQVSSIVREEVPEPEKPLNDNG